MPATDSSSHHDLRRLLEQRARPFPPYPQVDRYFPAASSENARQRISRVIDRGDGPAIVVGGAGTGKSLLLQLLAAQFYEQFDIVLLACARVCTRRALLQAILFELGLPYQLRDEGQLRLSLLDHLLSAERCPTGLVMLVDEAQALSTDLLDELRVLTNLVRLGAPRVRLVLAGSASIEESLACPALESLNQRLVARCILSPFSREETVQFIRAQIAAVGGAPDQVFAAEAALAVFEATDGVPRLVNQLCDQALLMASSRLAGCVDREIVTAAWADLQQLPGEWDRPSSSHTSVERPSIVEFGGLRDDDAGTSGPVNNREFDTEPTELDVDEESANVPATSGGTSAAPGHDRHVEPTDVTELTFAEASPIAAATARDPFEEHFDDEEVVLDDFAAWDNLFHRNTPRVENRREPAFAALLQAVLDLPANALKVELPGLQEGESPSHAFRSTTPARPAYRFEDSPTGQTTRSSPDDPTRQHIPVSAATESRRHPLRLAVVTESSDISRTARGECESSSTSYDRLDAGEFEIGPDEQAWLSDWSTQVAPSTVVGLATADAVVAAVLPHTSWDATPILVIEEDAPAPAHCAKAPVRREDYRNLFTRLRGI